jgi:hypothetical protein
VKNFYCLIDFPAADYSWHALFVAAAHGWTLVFVVGLEL